MKSRAARKIRCIETGEVFNSIHAAGEKYGRNYTNLSQLIQYNLPWTWAGLHWEAVTPNQTVQFIALPNKGQGEIFNTRKELAEFLQVPVTSVGNHLKSHTPIKGYILERKITME